jgi:hypothetical protein
MSNSSPRWVALKEFKPLLNPHICQCGNGCWCVEIMDNWESDVNGKPVKCLSPIGVLLKCTDCGYIETVWGDE